MGRLSQILSTIERVVVIVAATLAVFPLWQYWSEAEDRKRERIVREMQLAVSCISLKNEMADRLNTQLKEWQKNSRDPVMSTLQETQEKIVERFESDWTREHNLIAQCMRIGAISESG